MSKRLILTFVMAIFCSTAFCADGAPTTGKAEIAKPKYVFFFIGDGMGENQRRAGRDYLRAMTGDDKAELVFDTFAVRGATHTYSRNSKITDSAAAGTALACGFKTDSGTIGMDPKSGEKFTSIAEYAKQEGMKVGILSSVSLDHATPASFYAHQKHRSMFKEIAAEIPGSCVDYLAGGGLSGQKGMDKDKDVLQIMQEQGFAIARTLDAVKALQPGGKYYAFNHRLAGGAAMPFAIERKDDDVKLAEFVEHGIRLLDNEKGFFMMVEGGKIDWACHANDLATTACGVVAMDNAVKVALDFAKGRTDVLIVVTADHETGALELLERIGDAKVMLGQKITGESLNGEIAKLKKEENGLEQAMKLLVSGFGLTDLSDEDGKKLAEAWRVGVEGKKEERTLYGSKEPFGIVAQTIIAARAGYKYNSFGHSGVDVPVTAYGCGAGEFAGVYENTDIPRKIYRLITGGKEFPALKAEEPEKEPAAE